MSWRERTRRLLPYIVTGAVGFLIAYLAMFFFVFKTPVVPRESAVPDVMGLPWNDAARRLEAVGFRADTGEAVYHATAGRGTVLAQKPRSGAVEARGAVIRLDVSMGRRQAQVPRVLGMTSRDAQLALEASGFTVGDIIFVPSESPRGQVLATTPDGGRLASLPTTVRMQASAGPSRVEVPDLVGRPYGEARSMLEQIGLPTGRAIVDAASLGLPGHVIEQQPSARARVRSGASVRLTVAP